MGKDRIRHPATISTYKRPGDGLLAATGALMPRSVDVARNFVWQGDGRGRTCLRSDAIYGSRSRPDVADVAAQPPTCPVSVFKVESSTDVFALPTWSGGSAAR
ncbi:hypothetical protein GCM10022226_43410 [Sphaerisporangium flaviroseum]|uniref:Uncharacterized protein n=1 Tax=Sphaerisporangium flaviroseum TaxID=509199 RepID=A0ABP7IGW3_9ACTN